MGDLNLPNATWVLSCSPNDFENHNLTALSSFDIFLFNFSVTHKASTILDKVLCQHPCFSDISVEINCQISDHYPLMFTRYDNTETPISNPLTWRYSFNSLDAFVKFEGNWVSFTFVDNPSTLTVDQFYDNLLSSIASMFEMKTKKRLKLPFYYSPHTTHRIIDWTKKTIHWNCGIDTSQKNLSQLEAAGTALQNSVELNEITFAAGHHTENLSSAFNLLGRIKSPSIPASLFYHSKILKTDEDIASGFNEHFVSTLNSGIYDRTDLSYPNVFRLQEVFDDLFVEKIKSRILKLKETSSVRFDEFPTKLLKYCPDLFASLLYPLCASNISTQTYPDVWKTSLVLPLFRNGNKSGIFRHRPCSLLPILSISCEKTVFFYLPENPTFGKS